MTRELSPVRIESTAAGAPATIPEGVVEWQKDVDILYVSSGAARLQVYPPASVRPSWDNPPTSPHAYDDEFDAGSLDAAWTIFSAGTTNPAVAGTIDYTASLTTPIVDAATVDDWLTLQSDNSSLAEFGVYKTYTADTNSTFFTKFGFSNRNISANGETSIAYRLYNSGDANEWIQWGITHSGTVGTAFLQANNNGAFTTGTATGFTETQVTGPLYCAVWKKSDVYHLGVSSGGGVFTYITSVTKTGVTTLDRQAVVMVTGNETPSTIDGIDFIRYKSSLDYSLVN